MAALPHPADELPPYVDSQEQEDPNELLQPIILVLANQVIYSAESPDSSPLYELFSDIQSGRLNDGAHTTPLRRCQYTVKTSLDGTPRVTCRKKHIYDLKQPPAVTAPAFPFYLERISRQAIGSLGLKKVTFPRTGYRALRFDSGSSTVPKSSEYLFEVKKKDSWNWHDSDGNLIAMEDHGDGQCRVLVTRPLSRRKLDALVGMWCLRLWSDSVERNGEPGSWSWGEVKRILQSSRANGFPRQI
ncbi:uncharacterized protein BCR38DRAFT_358769 [Pseudomassariella vexata]|uniref:Tubby C-terminal-like domain-containing protein n=1 Tax=Pseudomassariella vexata TaxID=1141098 RepID=A0A1Y2EIG8_9PEZI|nr:uncharacterized protein BCR38DRAFT_358769 [Pseudomassariella vexata]ORY71382.1 hypothetical protein BCR38DRAFT_358769 [Pseudomassariella vexata]